MAWKDPEKRRAYQRQYYAKWNKDNPEKLKKYCSDYQQSEKGKASITARESTQEFRDRKSERKLWRKYKLTLSDYEQLLQKQNNVCACCKKPEVMVHNSTGEIRKLCVDHCHDTGVVRGLLCTKCNLLIGNANNNPDILESAAAYLRSQEI